MFYPIKGSTLLIVLSVQEKWNMENDSTLLAPQMRHILASLNSVASAAVLVLVFEAANFDRSKKYAALCVFLLKPA